MPQPITYKTNGFVSGSFLRWMFIISQGALLFMFFLIALGIPMLITIGLFIGSIFLGFKMVTGEVWYTLDDDGLTKEVSPSMLKDFWKKQTFQFYPWTQIKSFRAGREASRSYEEFEFITIFTESGKKLEINDKKGDKESFKRFLEAFRHYVAEVDAGNLADPNKPISRSIDPDPPKIKHHIEEKPNFYQTVAAKILTIGFTIAFLVLAFLVFIVGLGTVTSIFRLSFILIPGTIYMIYRVFIRKE